jgi:DNA polymerase I-like protein with 3'-5' exonuclease and polymerase domains
MYKINLFKNVFVYDVECDGLIRDATKIHCLTIGWFDSNGNMRWKSTTDYDDMRKFFTNPNITRSGHNITLYDERVVAKILGIDTLQSKDQIIDTLALSWYIFPERLKHGLEQWGEDLGIQKVKIKDWKNQTVEDYIHRCEEDVKINLKLWKMCRNYLLELYDQDEQQALRLIEYLQFKLDCVREQEDTKIKLDIDHIQRTLDDLKRQKLEKEMVLAIAMPKVPIKQTKVYKDVIVLDNGEFFEKGDMMYDHYFREGYRPKREHTVELIKGYKAPNPNSSDQKKKWLFDLGWIPEHYEYKKNEDGSQRKIPQIGSKDKDGSVCDSIKRLFDKEPALEVLEGLSVLNHRIGILEGFLENQVDGYIEPSMAGLTNTLRLKHVNIVNLPGVEKKLGKEIRGSLIASEGEILCGSDMSSLEDTTKQHYMYKYDPKYVKEMRVPGFDPHLDIAVLAGILTKQQIEDHKSGKKKYNKERKLAKQVNFSAVYGAGAPKIALTSGMQLNLAKKLHKIYWDRNKAVKQVAEACVVKQIGVKKWLFNPISKFWYSLRAEKDRFSTLNQGTGVFCFDTYIKHVRGKGIRVSLQMHDEILFRLSQDSKEVITDKLNESISQVNEEIKLDVPLGISMDYGQNYADCH